MTDRRFVSILLDFEADDTFPQNVKVGSYTVRRFNDKLRKEILEMAVNSISKFDKRRFSVATHFIEYKYQSDDYSYETLSNIFADIQTVINVLQIMKPTNAVGFGVDLTYSKRTVTKIMFLEPDHKKMYSASNDPGSYVFDITDSRYLNKLYAAYESAINEDGYDRLTTAYHFFANYFQQNPFNARLKVVCLVTAIEALFNTSRGDSAYKVSMRLANFISSNPSRRKNVYLHMKYIYSVRSSIVHGQSLGKTVYSKNSNINNIIYHVESYLRLVFLKIAFEKLQDVYALSNEELDEKFDEMLLGVKSGIR